MDITGRIFQISKFPDILLFVIIYEMLWRNLTKIGQICISYKFAQSGCIPLKIKCEILAHNSRHARRLSHLLKPQTNRTTGPPGNNDDGSRFPGKKNPLQKRFFISIAHRNVKEADTIMSKVAKGKGKTRGKNGKTAKCAEEQDNK